MNLQRNIVPPEMAALLLPVATSPKIKGYMFRRNKDGLFYAKMSQEHKGNLTILRSRARIYQPETIIQVSCRHWNWGHKEQGHWVVVYE